MASLPRLLLASDLDGTLIPTDEDPEHLRSLDAFRRTMDGARRDLALAYVTGRYFEQAVRGVTRWGLPAPDFLVCDVGTSVFRRDGARFVADEAFAARMRSALGGADGDSVRRALSGVDGLEAQGEEAQGTFKASFVFAWERRSAVRGAVLSAVESAGLTVELVTSRDPLTGLGLLDVLPAGGAKDRAVEYVARTLGLDGEQVVYAGDSGNDEAALLSGARAILVGNASDELRRHLQAEAGRRGLDGRLYLARGAVAAGVLEGLAHFAVLSGGSVPPGSAPDAG